jgi:hypothetical protein
LGPLFVNSINKRVTSLFFIKFLERYKEQEILEITIASIFITPFNNAVMILSHVVKKLLMVVTDEQRERKLILLRYKQSKVKQFRYTP